jgi:hypothetical protein
MTVKEMGRCGHLHRLFLLFVTSINHTMKVLTLLNADSLT